MKKRHYVIAVLLLVVALGVLYARRELQQSKWVAHALRHNDEQSYSLVYNGDPVITLKKVSGPDLHMQAPLIDGKHNLWLDDSLGKPVARLELDEYWIKGTIGKRNVEFRPGAVVNLEDYVN